MAGEYRQHVALYVVAGLDKLAFGFLRFNQDRQPNVICEIKEALSEKMRWDDTKRFELYKVDFTPQESLALRSNNLPSMDPTAKLHDFDRVAQLWPRGFPRTRTAFVADMMPDHESSSVRIQNHDEATRLVAHHRTKSAIYNGRLQTRAGHPIGLYCSAFDSFAAGLDSTQEIPTVKLAALSPLKQLQAQRDSKFDSSGRMEAIVLEINKLLDIKLAVCEGRKVGGSISTKHGAICLITEVMNDGELDGADRYVHAVTTYVEYWNDPALFRIKKTSCCPSFILEIAGPWMRVLGAVMLAHPVVQALTPKIWIGDNSDTATRLNICELSQALTSLSSAITGLTSFYDNLDCQDIDPTRFYPYVRHFNVEGHRTDFQYIEAVSPDKLVFQACANSGTNKRTIIIKFAESYNAKAHRLLAEAQLAPELLFVSSEHGFKVGGRTMIVMEKVRGKTLATIKSIPRPVKTQVLGALKLLHQNGIVFGDLRPPNVMAVLDDRKQPVGGMLVDFDWCGADGKAKYPTNINMKVNWPAGVGPGTTMKVEHDLEMLEKVFSSKVD